jgi:hypothetical protein
MSPYTEASGSDRSAGLVESSTNERRKLVSDTKNRIKIDEVKVTITFNGNDVYDAATAPTRSVSPWIRALNDVFDTGALEIVADDPTDGAEVIRKILTPNEITRAFAKLVELGFTHCSGYPIQDLDNSDACTADLILQQAVYGEIVWG